MRSVFLSGALACLKQNPTQVVAYYKKSLATNVYEFVEHRYARLEMTRLRQAVVEQAHEQEHEQTPAPADTQDSGHAH